MELGPVAPFTDDDIRRLDQLPARPPWTPPPTPRWQYAAGIVLGVLGLLEWVAVIVVWALR